MTSLSQFNNELARSGSTNAISLGDSEVRKLLRQESGSVSLGVADAPLIDPSSITGAQFNMQSRDVGTPPILYSPGELSVGYTITFPNTTADISRSIRFGSQQGSPYSAPVVYSNGGIPRYAYPDTGLASGVNVASLFAVRIASASFSYNPSGNQQYLQVSFGSTQQTPGGIFGNQYTNRTDLFSFNAVTNTSTGWYTLGTGYPITLTYSFFQSPWNSYRYGSGDASMSFQLEFQRQTGAGFSSSNQVVTTSGYFYSVLEPV
jgi:hypothetical protein